MDCLARIGEGELHYFSVGEVASIPSLGRGDVHLGDAFGSQAIVVRGTIPFRYTPTTYYLPSIPHQSPQARRLEAALQKRFTRDGPLPAGIWSYSIPVSGILPPEDVETVTLDESSSLPLTSGQLAVHMQQAEPAVDRLLESAPVAYTPRDIAILGYPLRGWYFLSPDDAPPRFVDPANSRAVLLRANAQNGPFRFLGIIAGSYDVALMGNNGTVVRAPLPREFRPTLELSRARPEFDLTVDND